MPIDVSSDALDAACESVGCLLPDVQLQPLVANYASHPPQLERFHGTTLAMYIGSSIGNFSPREARTILRNLRSELKPGDALLLDTDMVKDEATLVRAYDDSDGFTAAFNLNILDRLNRELGANFNPACFRHRARWNRSQSRIEMHLESTRDQCVDIPAARLRVEFAAFETIHTESSCKFTRKTICDDPQSGERIVGRSNLQALRSHHPGNPAGFEVRRILGKDDLWITEYTITYQGRPAYTVSIMEFRDGKVMHETQYFADPFEAPAWRSQWVHRLA